MRHIAVVGSGPAGYYTAEAAQKKFGDDVRIDIIDRPFPMASSALASRRTINQSRAYPSAMRR